MVERFEDKEQAVLMMGYAGCRALAARTGWRWRLIDEASSDLGSRFFIRIREELGLAYFVGYLADARAGTGFVHLLRGHGPVKGRSGEARRLSSEIAQLAEHGTHGGGTYPCQEKADRQTGHCPPKQLQPWPTRRRWTNSMDLGYLHYQGKWPRQLERITLEEVRSKSPNGISTVGRRSPPLSARSTRTHRAGPDGTQS